MPALVPILLDHRGDPIQASRALSKRPSPRTVRARFDAAQTTNENTRHWANADAFGPNAALDPLTRRTLRNRSRYEVANNTYASGMVRTLANDTIGTGPGLQIVEGTQKENSEVEEEFWKYCLAINLPRKMLTMRIGKAQDGESFASFFTNPRLRSPVKLDIQPHEPEMIASPALNFEFIYSDGLIFDDFGNVVGYSLLRQHPGESAIAFDVQADTIPARDMVHLFNCERAGQVRGCPEITPALPLYAQLRRYTLAVIRCAESAALPSWLLKTQQSPSEMEFGDEWDTLETERGMGVTLPAGYEMQQLKAEQPTSTYADFKRQIIAEIARCLNMPYNVAAGDSSSYNYSSGRLDHKVYYKAIRVERAYWEASFLDVLFARWWEEARLIPSLLPPALAAEEEPPEHQWRWDGDEHVDPIKEANATETRLKIGITSYADECSKLGTDFEVVQQQNANALGLTLEDYRARLADSLFGTKPAAPAADPNQPEIPEPKAGDPNG